jgi:hypothetical protein
MLQGSLCGGQFCYGDAVGRTADIIKADLVAEIYRFGITAMFTANAHF